MPSISVPKDAIYRADCRWAAAVVGGSPDFDSDAIRVPAVATSLKSWLHYFIDISKGNKLSTKIKGQRSRRG